MTKNSFVRRAVFGLVRRAGNAKGRFEGTVFGAGDEPAAGGSSGESAAGSRRWFHHPVLGDARFLGGMAVAGGALLYLLAALWHLEFLGLEEDETLFALVGLDVLRFLRGEIPFTKVPLLIDMHSPLGSYLAAPFLAVEPGMVSFKLPFVLLGLAAMFANYSCLMTVTKSRGVALFATLWLAFHPLFIISHRTEIFGAFTILFEICAVQCLSLWGDGGKARFLLGGGFFLGLGMSGISWFAYAVVAVMAATVYSVWRRGGLVGSLRVGKALFLGGTGFVVGAGLWLWAYLNNSGWLIRRLIVPRYTVHYTVNNWNYPANFLARLKSIGAFFHGDLHVAPVRLLDPLLGMTVLAAAWAVFRARRDDRPMYFLVLVTAYVLASPFIANRFYPEHMVQALPLFIGLSSVALFDMARHLRPAIRTFLFSALFFVNTVYSVRALDRYYNRFSFPGRVGMNSSLGFQQLGRELRGVSHPFMLDPSNGGLYASVLDFTSGGRFAARTLCFSPDGLWTRGKDPRRYLDAWLERSVGRGRVFLIPAARNGVSRDVEKRWDRKVRAKGLTPVLVRWFYDNDGAPLLKIVRLLPT